MTRFWYRTRFQWTEGALHHTSRHKTLPSDGVRTATLTRRLLELNASDLLHGSYGIQNENIVLTEALELSALDFEEFLASYESMTLALASHLRELGSYREAR